MGVVFAIFAVFVVVTSIISFFQEMSKKGNSRYAKPESFNQEITFDDSIDEEVLDNDFSEDIGDDFREIDLNGSQLDIQEKKDISTANPIIDKTIDVKTERVINEEKEEKFSHSDSHSHPLFNTPYKVEKNIYTENSMNSEEKQGCEELKNVRIVSVLQDKKDDVTYKTELKKMIIYNEIFEKPRCKRSYRR